MPIIDFPPVEGADEDGLLAIGGDFHPNSLRLAYSRGIFPWPLGSQFPLAWFSPKKRGVIICNEMHIPRKLLKQIRKSHLKVCFNKDFKTVISEAAMVHAKSQTGTWITDALVTGYVDFHNQGNAYSVEVRDSEDKLVGGLYGVNIGAFISGESMFHKQDNASKIALLMLLKNLKAQGIEFLDTQMVTPITKQLGASEIPRAQFIESVSALTKMKEIDFSKFETNLDFLFK